MQKIPKLTKHMIKKIKNSIRLVTLQVFDKMASTNLLQ